MVKWKLLSFALSSDSREKVLYALERPTTPTRVVKETGISKAHVSRILKKMVEKGLVELKTPEKRKGKIYVLTDEGKEILKQLS